MEVARALAASPDVLLLDEKTKGLNPTEVCGIVITRELAVESDMVVKKD